FRQMPRPICKWLGTLCLLMALRPAHGQSSYVYAASNAFPTVTLSSPVCIASPPGETNRLVILEQPGRIVVLTTLANPTLMVFMDITNRVIFNGESVLLGLAFHPDYASNGYFYVYYTGSATNFSNGQHDIVSRFQVSPLNPNQADTN